MRNLLISLSASIVGAALLVACNSREGSLTRMPNLTQSQSPAPPQQVHDPLDSARRITADELHKMWEENKVFIVDTRNDAAYKQGHIRGAVLIPAGEFATRVNEVPKGKFIATYCT
ncbi:MAG TPA: rhodanese-like domain-containing protein [Pyrinomonadaceae bacterium]|nr:rhodanese-like domain-containing protein [Pyrinomonadaceae bacterium]